MLNGRWRGNEWGPTDCRKYWTEYRAGNLTEQEIEEIEVLPHPQQRPLYGDKYCTPPWPVVEALGMMLQGRQLSLPLLGRLRLSEIAAAASWIWLKRTSNHLGS